MSTSTHHLVRNTKKWPAISTSSPGLLFRVFSNFQESCRKKGSKNMSTSWKFRFCKRMVVPISIPSILAAEVSLSLKRFSTELFLELEMLSFICTSSSQLFYLPWNFRTTVSGLFQMHWNCCSEILPFWISFHGCDAGKCWVRYFGLILLFVWQEIIVCICSEWVAMRDNQNFRPFIGEQMIQFLQFFRTMTKESKKNVHLFCFQRSVDCAKQNFTGKKHNSKNNTGTRMKN